MAPTPRLIVCSMAMFQCLCDFLSSISCMSLSWPAEDWQRTSLIGEIAHGKQMTMEYARDRPEWKIVLGCDGSNKYERCIRLSLPG